MVLNPRKAMLPVVVTLFAFFAGMCVDDVIDTVRADNNSDILSIKQRMEDARQMRLEREKRELDWNLQLEQTNKVATYDKNP